MDSSQDNPIVRFKAFFWALALFALFGIALGIIAFIEKKEPKTLEDLAATTRYENIKKIEAAQAANLSYKEVEAGKTVQVKPQDVFAHLGKELSASKPSAVENPAQVVPGSATAKAIEAAAANAAPVEIVETDANAPIDPAVMDLGKAQYALCMACHGADGGGVPGLAPPLANSEWVTGPIENPIRIVLRGLEGPISVNGVDYNLPLAMAALPHLTDEQLAAVLTYTRNSFGNKASAVTPDQVKAFRGEVGLPVLKASDLKAPK
jgi:mono/diheme cytochrome c family protein